MAKITLDAETFKALASATRLGVLRALDERRKTLTELARDMGLNKATVHEHLALLSAADLVKKRDDEGRKWIYYELTWRGQKLLHPQETTTFNVLLGLGIASAGGGMAMLGRALGWWLQEKAATMDAASPSPPAGPEDKRLAASDASSAPNNETSYQSGNSASPEVAFNDSAAPEQAPVDSGDDGTWLSVVVLGFGALLTVLALLLRRHLRPGPLDPKAPHDSGEP